MQVPFSGKPAYSFAYYVLSLVGEIEQHAFTLTFKNT